jgi:hypothetical protein
LQSLHRANGLDDCNQAEASSRKAAPGEPTNRLVAVGGLV